MKAYRFGSNGDLNTLRSRDETQPSPQRGEVLIRIRATSFNYRDLAMLHGTYPRETKASLIPMSDAAGEVVEVGEDVDLVKIGDRVINAFHPRWYGGAPPRSLATDGYGSGRDGWLCEYKVVSQEAVVRFPDYLDFAEAATLPCAALTAWTALTEGAPIRSGNSVLTQGTGGVSVFAVQFARLIGARVIATTSSAAKAERLLALGADHVINYVDVDEWSDAVIALTEGRGVDRTIEVGGAGTLQQSIKATAGTGEIVLVGFLAGTSSNIDFGGLFRSGVAVRRSSAGHRSALVEMLRAMDFVKLRPIVDRVFDFENVLQAWHYFEERQFFGKVVIAHG